MGRAGVCFRQFEGVSKRIAKISRFILATSAEPSLNFEIEREREENLSTLYHHSTLEFPSFTFE